MAHAHSGKRVRTYCRLRTRRSCASIQEYRQASRRMEQGDASVAGAAQTARNLSSRPYRKIFDTAYSFSWLYSLRWKIMARHFGHVACSTLNVHVARDRTMARGFAKHRADTRASSHTSAALWTRFGLCPVMGPVRLVEIGPAQQWPRPGDQGSRKAPFPCVETSSRSSWLAS